MHIENLAYGAHRNRRLATARANFIFIVLCLAVLALLWFAGASLAFKALAPERPAIPQPVHQLAPETARVIVGIELEPGQYVERISIGYLAGAHGHPLKKEGKIRVFGSLVSAVLAVGGRVGVGSPAQEGRAGKGVLR